jgi:hypothetical protein
MGRGWHKPGAEARGKRGNRSTTRGSVVRGAIPKDTSRGGDYVRSNIPLRFKGRIQSNLRERRPKVRAG